MLLAVGVIETVHRWNLEKIATLACWRRILKQRIAFMRLETQGIRKTRVFFCETGSEMVAAGDSAENLNQK
jgi:hypothetical protein